MEFSVEDYILNFLENLFAGYLEATEEVEYKKYPLLCKHQNHKS